MGEDVPATELCVEHWAPDPAIEGADEPPNQIGGARGRLCLPHAEGQKWGFWPCSSSLSKPAHAVVMQLSYLWVAYTGRVERFRHRKSFGSLRIKPHATTALAYFASIDLGSWGQAVNLQACARFGHSRNPRAGTSEFMSDLCIRRNRYM
ncbi:predicted protein [Histoplasma capsulatum G186AR]|uniref:Uncharacterized protein n=1 Tax=Ajellomyces capsulatus (strain G186AR / H82 / ATCC MYA-2454 / RMSCC 2432) TaxID=447093 RepID=C0NLP6_AJECG|nr:uncharacterized protein HCBG_04426 [Histoplasma capsulatum G186AR]EEH07547.1 predicted protein [Histoplasma capsulatum G186AR]